MSCNLLLSYVKNTSGFLQLVMLLSRLMELIVTVKISN